MSVREGTFEDLLPRSIYALPSALFSERSWRSRCKYRVQKGALLPESKGQSRVRQLQAMNPSSLLAAHDHGEQGEETSYPKDVERPHRSSREASTDTKPLLGTIVVGVGDQVSTYGPATSSRSYAVKPTPLPAREGASSGTRIVVPLKAGRGNRAARTAPPSSGPCKAAEPRDEQTGPPSTEPSRLAAPKDEKTLSSTNRIDAVAAMADLEELNRHYLRIPSADHGSASPQRDRDLLTTAELAFIDSRKDLTMCHYFLYINEVRARETPPRAPLSSILSINFHIGRGAWHSHPGPPDTVALRAWAAEKYGGPLD
ncbi:unnamed protein product [Jaminaea pallidilutea]